MAIYTNYGRFLKAKLFKEMLQEQGDTYMLLGLGNPKWDVSDSGQQIPIAPYNTSIISRNSLSDNQFYDDHLCAAFTYLNGNSSDVENALSNSIIQTTTSGNYLDKCKNLNPPFPCFWNYNDQISINDINIPSTNYGSHYIAKEDTNYVLRNSSAVGQQVNIPSIDKIDAQYFAELYLRGKALTYLTGVKAPVGLLGAVKCSIDYVKDIGSTDDNYEGLANQFWYGDRYWEIVNPDESDLDNYISEDIVSQDIYPHHLVFTATLNPRTLCSELAIDKCIVPRQIMICTRKNPDVSTGIQNLNKYRAYENYFNFGQYTESEWEAISDDNNKKLCFTLPCTAGEDNHVFPSGDFKIILNDYIRGQVRNDHSVDRFGYVIGF